MNRFFDGSRYVCAHFRTLVLLSSMYFVCYNKSVIINIMLYGFLDQGTTRMPQVSQVYKPIARIKLILLVVIVLLITYQLTSYQFNKHGQNLGISKGKFFYMVQCKCRRRSILIVKIIEFHQSINKVHSEKTLGIHPRFVMETSLH